MRRRNSASFATPIYASREAASVSWGYFVLTVICACVLAAGFFLAAKQHFNTMDYGMKNSKLREQVEDLMTEKRRLLLAREVSLSPAEIKRAARNLGFRERGEATVAQTVAVAAPVDVKKADKTAVVSRVPDAPRAVKATYSAPDAKPMADSTVKKTVLQSAQKHGPDMRMVAAVR